MTDFPHCVMQCQYFKGDMDSCKKYKQIPKEISNGTKQCKEYKKKNK